jgi:hypothetical protein
LLFALAAAGCAPYPEPPGIFDTDQYYFAEDDREVWVGDFMDVAYLVIDGNAAAGLPAVGDVTVRVDGPPGEARFSIRPWARAPSRQAAQELWDEMGLWAFPIDPPHATDYDAYRCEGEWDQTCIARVDGDQDGGAHLTVTLPANWNGRLEVRHEGRIPTDDLAGAERIPNIEATGLNSSLEVEADAHMSFSLSKLSAEREIVVHGERGSTIDLTAPAQLQGVASLSTSKPCKISLDCAQFGECTFEDATQPELTATLNESGQAPFDAMIYLSADCDEKIDGPVVQLRGE